MHVEEHDLEHDFPTLRQTIADLRASNPDFAALAARFDDVNGQILELERGDMPIGDLAFEEMKKERLRIKDQLYAMLSTYGRP